MGVYIKGFNMPTNCEDCFIHEDVCDLWEDLELARRSEERPKDCPLIEIRAPHGRLIDADKVEEKMIPLSFSVQNWISEVDLSFVPTVIEAEKGENREID